MDSRELDHWEKNMDAWSSAYAGHPLLAELETVIAAYGKLKRRLIKVVNISDNLHGEMIELNEALRESETRYRLLTDNALDVLWSFNLEERRVTYLSPSIERLTGYSVAETLARPLGDAFMPASAEALRKAVHYLDEHGTLARSRLELERHRKDGSTVWTEEVLTLIHTAQGRPAQVVGVSRDISARRAAQEEQRRFFAMVSHEFRTPLATIDGAIQRLEMTADDDLDEATRKRYASIQNAVMRLTMLLDDYLNQDRTDAATRGLDLNLAAPLMLLEDSRVSAMAVTADHAIVIDGNGMPDAVCCDPDLIRLTLRILADNAVKYTPAGTTVTLSCRRVHDGGTEFIVADNGPGIPADELPHVFEKFFRGRSAADNTGTGLGLHLARSVVESHGGNLTVRNVAKGGTEFTIRLPAEPPGR